MAVLIGSSAADALTGGSADDTLVGSCGDDTLKGGAGIAFDSTTRCFALDDLAEGRDGTDVRPGALRRGRPEKGKPPSGGFFIDPLP